ncbi:MAG: tetratricopeptide repeat protein [Bacteroidota bacterium]|jgi:tetratricopeptide (TPR) repeat protein
MKSKGNNIYSSHNELDYLSELGEEKIAVQQSDVIGLKKSFSNNTRLFNRFWIFQFFLLFVAVIAGFIFFFSGLKVKSKNNLIKNYVPRNSLYGFSEISFEREKNDYSYTQKHEIRTTWKDEKFIKQPSEKITEAEHSDIDQFQLENIENLETRVLDLKGNNENTTIKKSQLNIIFINGVKIANYHKYYFKPGGLEIELNVGNEAKFSDLTARKNWEIESYGDLYEVPITEILKNGIKAFSESNFKSSKNYFSELLNTNKDDVNALFYIAMSEFSNGNFEQAEVYFHKSLDVELNPFSEEAEFYLAQALVNLNKKEDGVVILKAIVDKNSFYANRARKIIEGLR